MKDGYGLDARPLDEAGEAESITAVSIDSLISDLVLFLSTPDHMVEDGIKSIDVRMDPDLGYPRWLRIVGNIDEEGFPDEITLVATVDLVGPIEPTGPEPTDGDHEKHEAAVARWRAVEISNYDFDLMMHYGCPPEFRGPFSTEVREGRRVSGEGPVETIDHAFDLIADAIRYGTDVQVTYDPALGYPVDIIIDPEAFAADGGLAFGIASFVEHPATR